MPPVADTLHPAHRADRTAVPTLEAQTVVLGLRDPATGGRSLRIIEITAAVERARVDPGMPGYQIAAKSIGTARHETRAYRVTWTTLMPEHPEGAWSYYDVPEWDDDESRSEED